MSTKNTIEARLQARIDGFIDEISAIVREAAVDAVREALLSGTGSIAATRRGPARGSQKRKSSKKPARRPRKSASGRRLRRTTEDLEELGARFLAHVAAHPGERLEQIAKSMRMDTVDLKRPVQLLMDAKQLRTEGQRRGTKYFTRGAGRKAVSKKTAKKGGRKASKKAGKKAPRKTGKKRKATRKKAA